MDHSSTLPPSAGLADKEHYDEFTKIPVLSQKLHDAFSGSHTQFACTAYFTRPDRTQVNCVLVLTCTQLFVCDPAGFVHRTILLERIGSVYQRKTGPGGAEREVLLAVDQEHDCLIRGVLLHEGEPQKPFFDTLVALHKYHHKDLIVHANVQAPLMDVAGNHLKPPPNYTAPLPQREQDFAHCPCWREADVLDITNEEFTDRVRNMFIVYHPEKLPQVTDLCRKYARRKGGALTSLRERYGPEPAPEHAAAVEAVLRRETRFKEIFPEPSQRAAAGAGSTSGGGGAATIGNVFRSSKMKVRGGGINPPLLLSTLYLLNQPSGGCEKVIVHVAPVNNLIPADTFRSYCRAADSGAADEEELWYMTNEGYVLAFSTAPQVMRKFGYSSGDRVLSTFGVTAGRWSVIVGVRDGVLWAHDEGDEGATALVGFHCRAEFERLNGWMLSERVRLLPVTAMPIEIAEGFIEILRIDPQAVYDRFGLHHGDVVASVLPSEQPCQVLALVCGVGPDGTLYVRFGNGDAARNTVLRASDSAQWATAEASTRCFPGPAVGIVGCRTAAALSARHGWQAVSSAPVVKTSHMSNKFGHHGAAAGGGTSSSLGSSYPSRRIA